MCKVFSVNAVVGLDENLSENGFSDRVVFGVELVKAVERVAVLKRRRNRLESTNILFQLHIPQTKLVYNYFFFLTACMSSVSTLRSYAVRFMVSKTSLRV